ARQRFLAHLAAVEHPPQILRDAGAREPRRVPELGLLMPGRSRERQNPLPVDFTRGRRARAPARTRRPGAAPADTAPPRSGAAALRLAGAFAARRRPVGEGRLGLLQPFVLANQRAQLVQPCPQIRADGVKEICQALSPPVVVGAEPIHPTASSAFAAARR
ncbi:MAG TPA: hypothetical protein VFR38_11435, partial [Gaiellaceae bacterium]|nr:hypothetical protein [Gaiellaceae bacterium]